ncbi:HAD family hydrolase [Janibacter sp. GS2]|uniref:HAD family hydrolase n=1 Tax=Janibacter sp. GS2 TaxID=3442646 RepID=UPI003EB806B9
MGDAVLASWRPGATRDAVLAFLEVAESLPLEQRVACFDNDGTLWCERPTYVQYDFFVDALKTAVLSDPGLAAVPEFAALLAGDRAAIGEMGLERIAHELTRLFEGRSPEEFTARVRDFLGRATHPTLGRPLRSNTYLPMRELIAELRARDFTVCIVTGGGTEFLRAVSQDLYGVPPENVVGSLIAYDFVPTPADGAGPALTRTARLVAGANEGPNKVTNIQTQLGRRPIFAAGNSGGDREMLEWAAAGDGPTLALVINHDDADREFDYLGTAETVPDHEAITDVAARRGWSVVSMAHDWDQVFDSSP